MLNPSATYLNTYKTPSRQVVGRIKYELDGVEYSLNPEDNLISIVIEKTSPQGKIFGFALSQKITIEALGTVSIPKGTRLIPEIFIRNTENIVELPYFYLDTIEYKKTEMKTVMVGYDILYNQHNYLLKDIEFAYPLLLSDYAAQVCAKLGGTATFYGYDFEITEAPNFDGTETLQAILAAIAEASGTMCYVREQDNIRFRTLPSGIASDTLTPANYFDYSVGETITVTKLISVTELGDNVSFGSDGYAQVLRENGFIVLRDDQLTILEGIADYVIGRTSTTYNINWRGCPAYEIGDLIGIRDKEGNLVKVYYLDEVLTYNGGLHAVSKWQSSNEENPEAAPLSLGKVISNTYAKVDKINQEINLVVASNNEMRQEVSNIKMTTEDIEARVENIDTDAIETLQSEMAALKLTSDSISQEVERVYNYSDAQMEAMNSSISDLTNRVSNTITPEGVEIIISQEMANGVDSVTTTTGYTFNNLGLTIDKAGTEMSTTITEDGMTIRQDNRAVLTATHVGVEARNLEATTFLTIGDSRFENYDCGGYMRTGCFWISN